MSTQDPHRPTSPAPRIYGTPATPPSEKPASGSGGAAPASAAPAWPPHTRDDQATAPGAPVSGAGVAAAGGGAPNVPVSPAGTAQVPPAQPPAPPKERRRRPLPILISLIALLLALVSAGLSWRASTKAQDAADRVTAFLATRTSAPQQTATAAKPADDQPAITATTEAPVPAGTGVPKLTATTDFKVNYADRVVTIPASCSNNIYVDLDEPRVQVPSDIGEVTFRRDCGATAVEQLRMQEGVLGALMSSSAVTPGECVDQIRDNPLPLNDNAPATVGQVFCIQSNYSEANTSGLTWKMVVLTVTAIARDGKVGLKLSAWDIPG